MATPPAGAPTDAGAGPDGGLAARGGRLTRQPVALDRATPRLPPGAPPGAVVGLQIDLDAGGRVTRALVKQSAGAALDQAALAALATVRFTPAEVDGRPSPIRFDYLVRFAGSAPDAGALDRGPMPSGPVDAGAMDAASAPSARDASAGDGAISDTFADALAPVPAPSRLLLRGRARARGNRAPLVGAEVSVVARGSDGAPAGRAVVVTETDAEGNFEVTLPPAFVAPHGVRVVVADPEFQPCTREVGGAELNTPAITSQGAVGVTAAAPLIKDQWSCLAAPRGGPSYETVVEAAPREPEATRVALTQAEARSVPGTMGDPLRAVQSLPGVARAPYGLGTLIVRGASPNDSGVFIDGVQLPLLYHFLIGPSVLPAALVEQIDFYPGGFGVRLGRLTAGAVEVTTRDRPSARTEGNFEASALDASLLLTTPLAPDTTLTVGARHSVIQLILPRLVPDEPGKTFATAVPDYWDYQARVSHRRKSGDRLSLFAFGSRDRLEIVAADPNRRLEFGNQITFHRVVGSWVTRLGRWTSRFDPAYGNGALTFRGGADRGEIRYQRLYLREELRREFGPRFALLLGFDGIASYDAGEFDITFPREGRTFGTTRGERTFAPRSYWDWVPTLFAEARIGLGEHLRLVPGIRFDPYYVVERWRTNLDPRLALHFAATPTLELRAGAGIYQQLPQPRYLDPEFGNLGLKMVRAEQYFVGFDHRPSAAVLFSLTAFAVTRHNVPVPSAERVSSTGKARARGVEVLLRHQLARHFYGWLAYTLSRAEQNADFAEEIEMGAASPRGAAQDEGARDSYRPATYDQTHNLVAVASYRRNAWEVGARYRLVSGRPLTPIAGAIGDLDFGGFTPERGPGFSQRRALFSQLDLRIERTFTFDFHRLGVFLDVQNVLNAENPEDVIYDYRYRQSAPVRGLPILPLLGLRGSF